MTVEAQRGDGCGVSAGYLATRGIGRIQKHSLFSSFIGWMFDGYETSTLFLVGGAAMMSLLPSTDPASVQIGVGMAISGTLLGWAVGGAAGSVFADYVGRKRMLVISIVGYSVLTALTALSPNFYCLVALRFLTGLFLGCEWSTGTTMIAETWPPQARAKALGIMQSGYGFGFLLAAGLWLVLQPLLDSEGWRWMFALGVIPAFFLIYIRRELPESQLWLDSMAIQKANGKEPTRPSAKVVPTRRFTLSQVFAEPVSRGLVFKTLVLACITVAVFYGTNALIPAYVSSIASLAGLNAKYWASMSVIVFNIGAIVSYVAAGFICDAVGRKPYMYFIFAGGLLAGPVMFALPPHLTTALFATAVLGFFTLGAFSWMPIYLPELFATRVRSTALGFVFNMARLIAFATPIYSAWLFTTFGGPARAVVSLSLLFVISLVIVFFLPETKGKPLPE
jgi:MFS family permease